MLKHIISICCCLKVAFVALFCITKPKKKARSRLNTLKKWKSFIEFFSAIFKVISLNFETIFWGIETTFRCTIATYLPRGDPRNLCESTRIRLLATQSFIVSDKGSFLRCLSDSCCTKESLTNIHGNCGLADTNHHLFICWRRKSRSIGYKPSHRCAFWQTSKQWGRWPILLFVS